MSRSSNNSTSSTYNSTGGRSETSLPVSELKLEALSFLSVCVKQESRCELRLRPVGLRYVRLKLAGGLMPGGRGVGTSVLCRVGSVPVGLKLAGRLMLGSREVRTSALGR